MSDPPMISANELLRAALAEPEKGPSSSLAQYREAILVLVRKRFTQERIAEFLATKGVRIHRTAISRYLRKHPPTEAETARIDKLLDGQVTESEDDSERRRKREELLARARKARKTQPEEDDTDYSFLNVQGRPFRIREKE